MTPTQLLKEQMNVEETNEQSGKLIDYIKIEGTPFTMVIKEEKYFITLGNYMMTEPQESYADALNQLEENKWNIILNMSIIINENNNK